MSIFGKILSKLGFGNDKPASTSPTTSTSSGGTAAVPTPTATQAPANKSISQVDVVSKLEQMASKSSEKLNWRTSIVDLMKLLGLDSSLEARKSLATELRAPAEKMKDSAQMNMWLHKTVLQKLAENGGNVPAELL